MSPLPNTNTIKLQRMCITWTLSMLLRQHMFYSRFHWLTEGVFVAIMEDPYDVYVLLIWAIPTSVADQQFI